MHCPVLVLTGQHSWDNLPVEGCPCYQSLRIRHRWEVTTHPLRDERAESLTGVGVAAAPGVQAGRRSLPTLRARGDSVGEGGGVSDPAPHP